jgi:hypothetical protein
MKCDFEGTLDWKHSCLGAFQYNWVCRIKSLKELDNDEFVDKYFTSGLLYKLGMHLHPLKKKKKKLSFFWTKKMGIFLGFFFFLSVN